MKGYTKGIEHEDLGPTSRQDRSGVLFEAFSKYWKHELLRPPAKRSVWHVLMKTVSYGRMMYGLGLYAAYSAISFGPILILNALTQHLQGTTT